MCHNAATLFIDVTLYKQQYCENIHTEHIKEQFSPLNRSEYGLIIST